MYALIFFASLEMGLAPTSILISDIPDMRYEQSIVLDLKRTYFTDLQFGAKAFDHFKIYGGIKSYQLHIENTKGFYPAKIMYNIEASVYYNSFSLNIGHECGGDERPYWNKPVHYFNHIATDYISLKIEIEKPLCRQ
jgi:hypothetical protein